MSKIACGVIAYNAERTLPHLLKSLEGHIDVLVLGIDQKTDDKTQEIAETWASKKKIRLVTHTFLLEDSPNDPNGPKNFDRARNENWALFPEDCDWGFWIDTDDVLRADVDLHAVADAQPDGVSQVWFQYDYFRNEHGNNTTLFKRERLVRLSVPHKWIRRLHEICISASGYHQKGDDRIWVEHTNRVEDPKKGERNFATLYKMLEDDPNDPWAILYLGMQLFGSLKYEEAARQFLKFVPLCDDKAERWQALVYAAKSLRMSKHYNEAEDAAFSAMREYPIWADPYYELSAIFSDRAVRSRNDQERLENATRAVEWHEEGLKHPPIDDDRLLKNPLDYDYNPAAVVQVCYQMLGQMDKAKALLEKAIAIGPDPRLIEVRDQYEAILAKRRAIVGGLDLAGHLYTHGEPLKARDVLRALPVGSSEETDAVAKSRWAIEQDLGYTESDSRYENYYFLDLETDNPDPDNPTPEEQWMLGALKKAGAKRVLDIGIGNAQTALYLAKNGIQVLGLDIDPRRVKAANFAAVEHGLLVKKYSRVHGRSIPVLEKHGRPVKDLPAQFWYGSLERVQKIRFGARKQETIEDMGPFDAVLLDGLLNRVRDLDLAVATAETLAPRVLITVPDGMEPTAQHKKGTLRAFSSHELEGLVVNRGTVIDSHRVGNLLALQYQTGTAPHNKAIPDPIVVIWCGPGWEPWTPDQINGRGLGGSETAVVHVAEEMVKRGLQVVVFAEAEGTWNGVHYRRYDRWNPKNPCWLFIGWRNPTVFAGDIQADLKYLWMHDVDCGPALNKQLADRIDTILVLSKWHKDHMRQKYALDDEKFTIIGNGIDSGRFDGTAERVDRILYSSSPDRGLEQALELWPEIRKRTGAELHIFYDFVNYDLMGGDPAYKKKILDAAKQEGVVWRGRVGQDQLAREMMKAKALFYPGPHPFNETFCITALEAQAAGCVPVTRDNGALPETNKYGIVLPNDSKPKRWFAAIQEALNITEQDRAKMREWALGQTWERVANRVIERSIEIDAERQQQESQVV